MTPKPSLLAVDTLDDRREIWHLLHRLAPWERVRFVDWCCRSVRSFGRGVRPSVHRMLDRIQSSFKDDKSDHALTNMLYADVLFLGSQWGLDVPRAAVMLEQVVKCRTKIADIPPLSPGPVSFSSSLPA